jgi:hypothetical protein
MTQKDWDQIINALSPPYAAPNRAAERAHYREQRFLYSVWHQDEADDLERAAVQRLMADDLKCPFPMYGNKVHVWEPPPLSAVVALADYDSLPVIGPEPDPDGWFQLNSALFSALPPAQQKGSRYRVLKRGRYRSRHEAEEALLVALRTTGVLATLTALLVQNGARTTSSS